MDLRTGPPFGVGVVGVEAAEACRRVLTLDILYCDRGNFSCVP